MPVKQAYNTWASTYDSDRNLTRDLDEFIVKKLLSGCNFTTVVEAGCGTGKNTLFLASIAEKVIALDFSEDMIRLAKEKVNSPHVQFSITDLTKPWIVQDGATDLVTFNLILEHIEDLSFCFSEAYRKLKEGGLLLISELHPYRQYQGVKANFQREDETHQIPAFIHHISDFINAAKSCGFILKEFNEWKHPQDENKPFRLVSFLFKK